MDDQSKKTPEKHEDPPRDEKTNASPACPFCDANKELCPLCTANMSVEEDE
jgi:hypothetical protein